MADISMDIPRRLNDPPRIFWWDLDVALLVIAASLAGMLAGFFLSGCSAGFMLAAAYTGEGRYEDAEKTLKPMLTNPATRPSALLLLAGMEKKRGKDEAAAAHSFLPEGDA